MHFFLSQISIICLCTGVILCPFQEYISGRKKTFCKNVFYSTISVFLKLAKYDPVNKHITEFWDGKNAFQDLDEPEEYRLKISGLYDSTTPRCARSKIVKVIKKTST